ncbi:hypothetical protein TNCV_644831 [Trichonephila clavipes]|nr:hypothetical protein TNCV_644831 [Trichonephila clavipes]
MRVEKLFGQNVLKTRVRQNFKIITLTHTTGGEGFDDLSIEDKDELLVDKTLSEGIIIEAVLETPNSKERSHKDEDHVQM